MAYKVTQDLIVKEVIKRLQVLETEPLVPIGVSNRHVHLSQQDLEILFGRGHGLTKMKDLKQPGQFAAQETVVLVGPKGEMKNVRVLGPVRNKTQVEISITDSYKLGVNAPIRESGKTAGTPGLILKGPKGTLELKEGVIAALRHIHIPPEFAAKHRLKDKEMVNVEVGGIRATTFKNVLLRVSERFVLEMHIDTDEANAAGIGNGEIGIIRKG